MRRIKDLALGLLLLAAVWVAERTLMAQGYEPHKEKPMARSLAWRSWWVRLLALIAFIIVVLVTMTLTGCAYVQTRPTPIVDKHTVLVVNQTNEEYTIYADGTNIGRVHAGYSACLTLPTLDTGFLLVGKPVYGGKVRFSPPLDNYRNWTWVLTHLEPSGEDENLNLAYNHC